ncbi:MAG: ribosome maturation factor RimM [Pseudomonadales bacterium]
MDSASKQPDAPVSADDILVVGRIGAAHGIRGWVHVTPFTDPPENLARLRPLLQRSSAKQPWVAAGKTKIKQTGSSAKARWLALLPGVDTRNAAEALRGLELGLRAADLPAPEADSFYWRDLCGLQALDPEGKLLGRVESVLESPAHDILEITVEPGLAAALALEAPGRVLVPFVNEFTQAIDLEAKTIVIDWPEVFVPGAH